MGRVVDPPPFHYGTDCPECTPHLWPVGKTPMYVFCYFSGMEDCGWSAHPAPNGYTFLLQQVPGSPCFWLHQGDVWNVDFMPIWQWPNFSRVRLMDDIGMSFFNGTNPICQPEIIRYVNAQNACILMYAAAGGYCMVDWSGTLITLINSFGIERFHTLMRESRYVSDTEIVYKLCSLYQRTNIRFKISL